MEQTAVNALEGKLTDAELWGCRPVQWGIRMLGSEPGLILQCLSPDELWEAADFLGIRLPPGELDRAAVAAIEEALRARARELECAGGTVSVLDRNLGYIRDALHLDSVELALVAFRAMLRSHPGFEALAGKYVGLCADFVFHRKLGHLFGVPATAVTAALAPSGGLAKSGLVRVHPGLLGPLEERVALLTGLISPLMTPNGSAANLLAAMMPAPRPAHLSLADYGHLADETKLLRACLKAALSAGAAGRNVLLWGEPGNGKTELAAALAASLQCPLYASEPAFDDGAPLSLRERLCRLTQVQKLARVSGGALVMIDEAEDLFPSPWSDLDKAPSKGALNECLESNPTPTIWISNRVHHIDEAFLRRFDLVIHVPPLPARAKDALLRNALPPGTLDAKELGSYARQRELSPAVIDRMARIAVIGTDGHADAVRANLDVMSRQYLRALGSVAPCHAQSGMLVHDPELLNTDPPLDTLRNMLAQSSRGGIRMLLHGASGTGKTALAKAMAERMDKPLVQRKASSLLSKWVGGTEQNLAEMFDEARREDGVLLLDEADSFLRSRDRATAAWQVTEVNELLTQMEAFDGTLVCTTNRLKDLDPAALRRFDFKVAFKPLRRGQRIRLVGDCLAALGTADDSPWRERAGRLDGLTPSDAAVALRRLRVSAQPLTADALLDALAGECQYKPAASRPIGFVQ